MGPAQTAHEAANQALDRKRLGNKIRLDALEKLFDESENPVDTRKSRTEAESDHDDKYPNNSKDNTEASWTKMKLLQQRNVFYKNRFGKYYFPERYLEKTFWKVPHTRTVFSKRRSRKWRINMGSSHETSWVGRKSLIIKSPNPKNTPHSALSLVEALVIPIRSFRGRVNLAGGSGQPHTDSSRSAFSSWS
ncbi:hypothetical protein PHJA_000593400 [Phtheirospermum japonicum]|uniref:Uncharacterized protein n=1 Tax=Phtheirospermum japonicum TaxID=374723 RepID=A0A830BKS6_9LAMI|nr:hypothetical protein PHJA_000593400 [Phtheirospermum japonicum]